jgi:hypothetical protein
MIEGFGLKVRQIEFIGRKPHRDVTGQGRMPLDRRQLARAAALVGHRILLADAEREMRIVIKKERGDVIVIDEKQNVRPLFGEPALHRPETLEDRCPDRIALPAGIQSEADGRGMRGPDASHYRCHAGYRSQV